MKKKIFLFLIIAVTLFLYFENKFDDKEVGLYSKNYTITSNENKKINLKSNIKKIKIYFNQDEVENHTEFTFNILDKNNKNIYKEKIMAREARREYYTVDLSENKLKNEEYYIRIIDSKKLNSQDFKCNMKVYYSNNKKAIFLLLYLIVSVIFFITFLLNKIEYTNIHKHFLYIAIPIFSLYLVFIPLTTSHDEFYQWIRSYEVSEGIMLPNRVSNSQYLLSMLPKNINLNLSVNADFKYKDLLEKRDYNIRNGESYLISSGSMGVYSPVQFLPQALGISFARIFTGNVLTIAYFGRLFNMIVCITLLTLAIKITPIGKKLLLLLSLNPISIELFTTLSSDGITISISYLLIAYILSLLRKKDNINKKEITILSVLSCVLALCKIVYIFIPFLLLLIPKEKFKNKSRKEAILFSIIVPIGLNLIWLLLASSVSDYCAGYSVPSKNFSAMLHNPLNMIKYFIYSIDMYGFDIFFNIFSRRMLMSNVIENTTIVPLLLLYTFFNILKDSDDIKFELTKKNKIFILSLVIIVILLIYVSLYISWCSYKDIKIYGVQGRYFLPILPLVYILIKSVIKLEKKKYINKLLYFTVIIVNYMTLMEIIVNFL